MNRGHHKTYWNEVAEVRGKLKKSDNTGHGDQRKHELQEPSDCFLWFNHTFIEQQLKSIHRTYQDGEAIIYLFIYLGEGDN